MRNLLTPVFLGLAGLTLAACDQMPAGGGLGAAPSGGSSAFREYLVVGNRMTFEQCRARGGFIIRDPGSPMVMCDPSVRGEPIPANEFDHPNSPVPQPGEDA